jgi:hypothetical protein
VQLRVGVRARDRSAIGDDDDPTRPGAVNPSGMRDPRDRDVPRSRGAPNLVGPPPNQILDGARAQVYHNAIRKVGSAAVAAGDAKALPAIGSHVARS